MKIYKLLGLLIVIVMLAALVPMQALAQDPTEEPAAEEDIDYAQQRTKITTAAFCQAEATGLKLEDIVVGFSQMENNNPWRIGETESMKAEGVRAKEYYATDAQAQTAKQVSDIEDLIARGVDVLIIAPREFEGLAPALEAAKEAGVPVFLVDREAKGTPCEDFITFMGSNFVEEGERAAQWLVDTMGEEGKVIELEGTIGASCVIDRGSGFRNVVDQYPGIEIVASQSGDFTRALGQQVMEQLIQAFPDADAVYAHNDEMAVGAIQALKDAGKKPGEDIIVVSVDGTHDALQAIIDGDLGCTVECNPRFGPLAFDTIEKFLAGEPIPTKITVVDGFFDSSNAEEFIEFAY